MTASPPLPRRATRGRPKATDHDAIALVALELFAQRGFDNVTMEEIADAARISRTTLWRYFPSKSAVLWIHHEARLQELREALAAQSTELPVARAAFDAWRAVNLGHPEERPLERRRNQLITTAPTGVTDYWTIYEAWGRVVVEFVAARRGGGADDWENVTVGLSIWAAMLSAGSAWVRSEDPDPAVCFDRALALLADCLPPR